MTVRLTHTPRPDGVQRGHSRGVGTLGPMLLTLCLVLLAACGGGGAADASTGATTTKTSPDTLPTTSPATTPADGGTGAVIPSPPAATPPVLTALRDVMAFSFSLSAARTTSAGVYAAGDTLVRTLWRGESLPAGEHTRTWDHRMDDGSLAPAGNYTVRLIHHQASYRWEGVIGNSSGTAPGSQVHRSYMPPTSLVVDGTQLHFAVGFNEAQNAIQGFDTQQPQLGKSRVSLVDPWAAAGLLASDGRRLYWANTGGFSTTSFVAAFDLASGRAAPFDQGEPVCLNRVATSKACYVAQNYDSVIALRQPGAALPSGLAVQKNGPLLAVAYGADKRVLLFDKLRGDPVGQIAVDLAPHTRNHLAMSRNGDLWIITSSGVQRYTDLTGTPRVSARLQGIDKALALAADPNNDGLVWVADGGDSQQLKGFNNSVRPTATVAARTALRGAQALPVDNNSLSFLLQAQREQTALVVDDEGSVWVVDTGNNRLLRFDSAGRFQQAVAYLPHVYASAVDSGRPTRVFANFLEFEIDYGRDLSQAGAWRLIKNWLPGVPSELRDNENGNFGFAGFRMVHTLANGRTYAFLDVAGTHTLVELTAVGTVRRVLPYRQPKANESHMVMYSGGELGWAANEGGTQNVHRLTLERFDATGEPVWASNSHIIASAPLDRNAPYYRMDTFSGTLGPRFPVTDSGKVIFFNQAVNPGDGSTGFHLGAVKQFGKAWDWQASPSGALDGRGSFQTRVVDNNIQYGGNVVMVEGRSIVYGYHGEGYTDLVTTRVGQANQFMHFLDNGLFVGQFGTPSTDGLKQSRPGLSGNAFSPSLVKVAGVTYLYHNDESSFGGVHRWRLEGLDSITEISASGGLGSSLALR
jgi:hypothetical protein